MRDENLTRRRFLQGMAVAVPAGSLLVHTQARAEELPHVDPNDPAAKALLYVNDAKTVDKSNPAAARYEPGQHCGNCVQLQGEEGATWRPCGIFPGKAVNVNGWCSVWAPKS